MLISVCVCVFVFVRSMTNTLPVICRTVACTVTNVYISLYCVCLPGTSVYFMAEEISEGSCQLPRDENGSEDSCGAPPSPPSSHLLEERSVTGSLGGGYGVWLL